MTGRIVRLVAWFGRPEPRGTAPTGWVLSLDAVIAVALAGQAVFGAMRVGTLREAINGVVVATIPGPHASLAVLILVAMTGLPLAVRRLYPITVWFAVIAAILIVHGLFFVPPIAFASAVFAAYSTVVHSRYRNLAIFAVLIVTIDTAATLGSDLPHFRVSGTLSAVFLVIVVAAAAGLGVRQQRRRLADSAARLRRASVEYEAATLRALAAERARIASELHDVVTHNVSVMVVQAGAARTVLASSPGDAEAALLAVEASGRTAMAELRNLLGLLSPNADGDLDACAGAGAGGGADVAAALRPQPSLTELDTLIDRVSAAGLAVGLQVTGAPRALPPGADLVAYRVVQEALTNVLRHAGRTAVSVTVGWEDALTITVRDDGGDDGTSPGGPPGRGLLGLRERLSLYGGELTAGPLADGGWQLRAVLPL